MTQITSLTSQKWPSVHNCPFLTHCPVDFCEASALPIGPSAAPSWDSTEASLCQLLPRICWPQKDISRQVPAMMPPCLPSFLLLLRSATSPCKRKVFSVCFWDTWRFLRLEIFLLKLSFWIKFFLSKSGFIFYLAQPCDAETMISSFCIRVKWG